MTTLLIYMVKAAVYIAGFYIIYFIFLSRDTSYTRNRAYIVLSVISAFILPLISVNIKEQSAVYYFGKTISEVFVTAESTKNPLGSVNSSNPGLTLVLIRIYLAGTIVFFIKLFTDIINLLFLIARNRKENDHVIYFNGFNTSGFSAMGYIFINKSLSLRESEEIIRHEQTHLENNHFFDILLVETIKVFQWFNPFIYLINRSLRAIHEYQADRECIQSGMAVASYQSLLLNNIFRSGRFSISNSFSNPSLIRKRMLMMVKKPSGKSSSLKILLVIPVIVLFLSAISSCEKNIKIAKINDEATLPLSTSDKPAEISRTEAYTEAKIPVVPPPPPPPPPSGNETTKQNNIPVDIKTGDILTQPDPTDYEAPAEVFVVVQEMPVFPGGEAELMKFIYANIVYPESAKAKNIEGRVILRFCVTYKGGIDQVQVLKPVDPELDNEAIRVIKMLPDWIPGKQGGKPVNVWYSVPVTFQLKK